MSYFKIAQDYFNSHKLHKLPQDFKPINFYGNTHEYTLTPEFLFHQSPACSPANTLEDLDSPAIIEHYTMFMLFSSIASDESIWNGEI